MALVSRPYFSDKITLPVYTLAPAGSQRQTVPTMAAIDVPYQQRLAFQVERRFSMVRCPVRHNLLRPCKEFRVNDLQFGDNRRLGLAVADNAGIDRVLDDPVDRGIGKVFPIGFPDIHFGQVPAQPLGTVALMNVLFKN